MPESLQALFVRVIVAAARHRLFFMAVTAPVAGVIAVFFLRMSKKALREELWIRYFGFGFLIFGLCYGIPAALGIWKLVFPGDIPDSLGTTMDAIRSLASAANNPAFLAAACALWWPDIVWRFKHWALALAISLLSVAMDWWVGPGLYYRLLDGLYSAVAVGLLGIVFFLTSPRRRGWLAALAFFGAGLYVLLELFYAAVPLLANGTLWGSLQTDVAAELGAGQVGPALDTACIAAALVLKLFLAVGGFALVLRALVIISPRALSPVLAGVTHGELNFFSRDGIVKAIGRSLQADHVMLCYHLPGRKQQRIGCWDWQRDAKELEGRPDREREEPLPTAGDNGLGDVLAEGITKAHSVWGGKRTKFWLWHRTQDSQSRVMVPVFYHGHVTGCLEVRWCKRHAFTPTAVQHMERLAEYLASSIEPKRRLATLRRWSPQLQELFAKAPTVNSQRLAETLAYLVHDLLSPLSTGVSLRVGFDPAWGIAGDSSLKSGPEHGALGATLEAGLKNAAGIGHAAQKITRTLMNAGGGCWGSLEILWPKPGSTPARPIVTPDELHLDALTSLMVGAIRDAAQMRFSVAINRLQGRLATVVNSEEWLSCCRQAAEQEGILWVVGYLNSQESSLGQGPTELVRSLEHSSSFKASLAHLPLDPSVGRSCHYLRLRLHQAEASLWLGVGNPNFGPELVEGSPWQSFLERLAGTADGALVRLKLQREAGEMRNLMMATVDTGSLIHEMRNIARNFTFAAQSLDDARRAGLLQGPEDIHEDIAGMLESAQRLYQMADTVLRPMALEGSRTYLLKEVATAVAQLMEPVLNQRELSLAVDVPADLQIKVPPHIVHLALVSLISNSMDAMKSRGIIQVRAVKENDKILCHVTDTGPGIKLENPQLIFELGFSTKGTGGKGLFMVRSMLQREGADVRLTDPTRGRTCFTLVFPLPA